MNIEYIYSGDYFIPDLKLPEETRPIGKWGRMHRDYLKEHHPVQFNNLAQLKSTEGITEVLKATDPMSWTQHMNNITARAEEIIREELIYNG